MRLAAFVLGMVGSGAVVAVTAASYGFSVGRIVLLVVSTFVVAQLLYLGLILAMARDETDRRTAALPPEASPTASPDSLLTLRGRNEANP